MTAAMPGPSFIDRAMVICALLAGTLACGTPVQPDSGALVERTGITMGSEVRFTAWTPDEPAAVTAFDAAFAEFERLDGLMSVWRDGSDIQRLNAAAGQHPVAVSEEVLDVLRTAHQISEWSGGKFDVTFGALSGLWRFDHDQDNRIPSRAEIAARLPLVDYRDLELRGGTALLKRQGMRAHLGGIGKGYAVDLAARILREHGLRDFLIQAGGDLYVAGRRGDRPWQLGIQDPRGPADESFAALDLADAAVSTSGDYERFFTQGGRRYHHILDPATGAPADSSRSVTIVADRAVLADALSTAVFVLGPDAGMALVERSPRVEAVIVTAGNNLLVSSGLTRRLVLLRPPSDGP